MKKLLGLSITLLNICSTNVFGYEANPNDNFEIVEVDQVKRKVIEYFENHDLHINITDENFYEIIESVPEEDLDTILIELNIDKREIDERTGTNEFG